MTTPQELFTRSLRLRIIEHFKKQSRFGHIFTLVMNLTSLVVAGNVIANYQRILALLTNHFERWYITPCNRHSIAKNILTQEIPGMNL